MAFVKNHSTDHALLSIVDEIRSNIDKGLFSCGVFVDLKKPSTPLTMKIFWLNLITMVSGQLQMTGSDPT